MKVLIVGCGYVGMPLAERLLQQGIEVLALRRNLSCLSMTVPGIRADVFEPASLTALPEDITTIVYCVSAGSSSAADYQAAYVDGVRNMLQASQKTAVSRFLFVSSTSVYHQNAGEWVDENSSTLGTGEGGRILLAGEKLVSDSPFETTIVRFSGIYGPARARILHEAHEGALPPRLGSYTNRIHRDDCAGALGHLLLRDRVEALYLASDNLPALKSDVYAWLAEQQGVSSEPYLQVNEEPSNKRCRNTRLLASGYRFQFPTYREGYKSLLAH